MATQLETLPPELLAGLLTDAIEAFLDARILAEDREVEERERRQIARALPLLRRVGRARQFQECPNCHCRCWTVMPEPI